MPTHHCVSRAAVPLAVAAVLAFAPGAATQQGSGGSAGATAIAMPTSGIRAELIRDVESLERKYLGLAEAMEGNYEWRPGEGVRSVGEVLMHVAGSNFMMPTMIGMEPPEELQAANMEEGFARMQELEQVSDPAQVKEMLQRSFEHVRQAIAATPDDQLDDTIQMFGSEASKRAALNLVVTHMHEHLGQSIAYARTNGVVPPWSADGGE